MTALLLFVHLIGIVFWVGGMAFAHFCLRPALPLLAPPERLRLMHAVLTRFLNGVLAAALMTLASGLGSMFLAARAGAAMPWSWHAMAAIGLAMIAVFAFVRLGPYARLARAVAAADWPAGAAALASVRKGVVVNLALGVLVVAIAVLKP
ncbi:MAG: CopD family protein [Simplicispira sp.]|nr:CopD family protein [Simplicispira sp.]